MRLVLVFCFLIFGAISLCDIPSAHAGEVDSDLDGISDKKELIMGTDPLDSDTDSDGYLDGEEIASAYDPLDPRPLKPAKRIEVTLSSQKLSTFLGRSKLNEMTISSGRWNLPTPTGTFTIINKDKRAWSKAYGLWMPYWMGFKGGKFGIHELPEWPNGYKEGQNHLGKPVSHGCIRLGVGDAKKVFNWTPVGTKLVIKK